MSHIDHKSDKELSTSPKYYELAAQCGEFISNFFRAKHIAVSIGHDGYAAPPAFYLPESGEIHVNADIVPVNTAQTYGFSSWKKSTILRSALLAGALIHEGSHVEYTTPINLKKLRKDCPTPRHYDIITLLEEPRIEKKFVEAEPSNRHWLINILKTSTLEIVLKDVNLTDSKYGASVLLALSLARVDAGVLSMSEITEAYSKASEYLDKDTINTLQNLWREYFRLSPLIFKKDPSFNKKAIDIADRWIKALDLKEEELYDQSTLAFSSGEKENSEIKDVINSILDKIEQELSKEAAKETAKEDRKERGKLSEYNQQTRIIGHGYSPSDRAGAHVSERDPSTEERKAAVLLGRLLERVTYVDKAKVPTESLIPPGRLNTRGAVARTREVAQQAQITSTLWKGKHRIPTDEVPLSVGLIVDISGSMYNAVQPMGSSVYILTEATRRIQGHIGTVLMGERPYGIKRAKANIDKVSVWEANDGFESFGASTKLLNSDMNLLTSTGARLLVIASDANYTSYHDVNERENAATFMQICKRVNLPVLWLDFTKDFYSTYGWGQVVKVAKLPPVEVAQVIGKAVIQSVEQAKQRNR